MEHRTPSLPGENRKMLDHKHFSMSLKKDSEFGRVFKAGQAYHGPYFTYKVLKAKPPGLPSRFGIVISTKVAPKAVDRNRAKRQIKEIVRLSKSSLKPGFWVVLIVKPEILGIEYKKIEKEFIFLSKKAGVI